MSESPSLIRSAEPLTPSQRDRVEVLRERFERELSSLGRKHGLHHAAAARSTFQQLDCGAAWVYLRREGPENDDSTFRAFYADVSRLSAEIAAELRKVLTVRQRVVLQAVDY